MSLEKEIARELILAQVSSMGGKRLPLLGNPEWNGGNNPNFDKKCRSAWLRGYHDKTSHIVNAINLCQKYSGTNFRYYVATGPDQNGHDSNIIYFDVKINGKRYQISFHDFSAKVARKANTGRKTRWDGNPGGSLQTAIMLKQHYDL